MSSDAPSKAQLEDARMVLKDQERKAKKRVKELWNARQPSPDERAQAGVPLQLAPTQEELDQQQYAEACQRACTHLHEKEKKLRLREEEEDISM